MAKKLARAKGDGVFLVFKILGDHNRFRTLTLLMRSKKGMCVQDLAEKLDMSHSAVSHQLGTLNDSGVVSYTKEGREMRYTLSTGPVGQKIVRVLQSLKV